MKLPASTGQSADRLGVIEPRLNDLVRRGKIVPEPPILAGRRLWALEHLLQAAEALGVLTDDLRAELEAAPAREEG